MSTHHEDDYEPTLHPVETDGIQEFTSTGTDWCQPHAFHLNLPPHFYNNEDDTTSANPNYDRDGIRNNGIASTPLPVITKFALFKARQIVDLSRSIQLHERMFEHFPSDMIGSTIDTLRGISDENELDDTVDDEDDDVEAIDSTNQVSASDMLEIDFETLGRPTENSARAKLLDVHRKCARLQSQISGLENLKCGGITQTEICEMFLHLLRLVSATVSYGTRTTIPNGNNTSPVDPMNVDNDNHPNDNHQNGTSSGYGKPKLHYEDVGRILHFQTNDDGWNEQEDKIYTAVESEDQLNLELDQEFALPSPTREVLLLTLINILSKKGPLRSVSNDSIYIDSPSEDYTKRSVLILEWKPLLRMLLRTAPYLDERKAGKCPVQASNSRHSNVLKRTVQLCRDARHFFEQGIRPPHYVAALRQYKNVVEEKLDQTSNEIWDMVASDVLFHSHTHACYRGTILLYLFQPSRCTPSFYQSVLHQWWVAWTNIDRCPEYDFLWLTMFCRARKYVSPEIYDWAPVRQRILTHCQYWLQLPIGGTSLDKSFPRVASPRSRSCPPRLKVFAGANSSYEEGIDFVAKVSKLLVASVGTGKITQQGSIAITDGTKDVLSFLTFVTPYFNPSNLGSWTFALGALLHYFAYELCCRLGAAAANAKLEHQNPALLRAAHEAKPGRHADPISSSELVAMLDALLPLCKQALYSKNGHVGRAGEAAMLYLVQIDPDHATPAFIDMAISALDIAAVNLSHQAPAALSALTRLIQPSLRSDPAIVLSRLPEILRLSLAGIDSNDQNKTIRTLVLYRSLTSWIPVGGKPDDWATIPITKSVSNKGNNDGTVHLGDSLYETLRITRQEKEYTNAIKNLPSVSLLTKQELVRDHTNNNESQSFLVEEAASAMSDWSLEFLDRIYSLLRASGEREKTGKNSSAVANRHSNADVHQARNFSRVLKECLLQLFAAMDDNTHALATRSVCRFLQEETLLSASKDASLLCQAAAAARIHTKPGGTPRNRSPGLTALLPILADNLNRNSTKTLCYRLRCLAGAVRFAGVAVIQNKDIILTAIGFALSSDDRHLFKTGCKLLRHTLSSLTESYVIPSDCKPRFYISPSSTEGQMDDSYHVQSTRVLGRSAQLQEDPVKWHVPDGESIDLAWFILNKHVLQRISALCENVNLKFPLKKVQTKMLTSSDVNDIRKCLRVIRYSIRGGASVMLDNMSEAVKKKTRSSVGEQVPYEEAVANLIEKASEDAKVGLRCLRSRICAFVVVISAVIASETLYPETLTNLPENDPYRKMIPIINSDPKVCKETVDIALLLLTRRGASFRSQEARTIWKAQKQLATDFILASQIDHLTEIMQGAALFEDTKTLLYKDGEDGGKTLPRRLLVARVQLFHDSLQRHASFEIPRRLRRLDDRQSSEVIRLFSVKSSFSGMMESLESMLSSKITHPLNSYEGIADGLYALCCHSNSEIRASSMSVIDYALTRFGWMVAPRVPRLLAGLALKDKGMNGKFGVPCCYDLVQSTNQQGKRKLLAETVKGICSILSLSRSMKVILQNEKLRFVFAQTICGTDGLISLLPTEEMQKLVHYFQAVFSPFRSKYYYQPRIFDVDIQSHNATLDLVLTILSEKKIEADLGGEGNEGGAAHWRKLLLAGWFLMTIVDEDDLNGAHGTRVWATCFRIIETESGQPLQRVALGLLGRLVSIVGSSAKGRSMLASKMSNESFCKHFVDVLVFDHKEDTSVGGGHNAQWATGVEDVMRDAARNIAPRTLFPFQRTSQALASFKYAHSQLVEAVLQILEKDSASVAAINLLNLTKELAAAPPSEDQRNQQITSAEVIAGVCGSFLRRESSTYTFGWVDTLLPLFEEVVNKVPFTLTVAFFDTLRYALQFCPASSFLDLTKWIIEKISSSLWQSNSIMTDTDQPTNTTAQGSEGFTAQSKWLCLCTAVIIEIDESESDTASNSWYLRHLVSKRCSIDGHSKGTDESWQLIFNTLLPRLIGAVGHPFDSCRDHISRCLFRICYCYRKTARVNASNESVHSTGNRSTQSDEPHTGVKTVGDPGSLIVNELASLMVNPDYIFTDRYNALSTARRFMSYCVHLGEAKSEYSEYVIPLLPLSFESLKSTVDEDVEAHPQISNEDLAAKRALEAEVIKGFRFTIAEMGVTAVISYGRAQDIDNVLEAVSVACKHETWQVRHAGIHFLRCFEGAHKFLFNNGQASIVMQLVADLLADDRREISSAAMAALTGILAALPPSEVSQMVKKYASVAEASKMKKQKKLPKSGTVPESVETNGNLTDKDFLRAQNQKISVFFLCAAIMAQPYETPPYVPAALAAISKHSFERNAPLGVRDTVKRCCAEYKRTHMSDNWELHRAAFTQEQIEALDDVVSSPHYYA